MSSEILNVAWNDIEKWLREVAASRSFDTIVGITRCGLPLCAALSALRPEATLAVLTRRGPRGEKLPAYDFQSDRISRKNQLT